MKIELTVFKASSETRELVSKDGVKSSRNIAHISGFGDEDMYDITVFDPQFPIPEKGKKARFTLRKYECFGGVATCVCDSTACEVVK